MNQTTANYDEPWKEALTEYFEAFLYFFFPEVHLENGFLEETRFLDLWPSPSRHDPLKLSL
ncbi:hypothetical protein B1L04_12035 [Microcystis aeruginosa KW]|uniref:Uncharacterized protein n=1 Tax=Microcystis aeruginosa KW TaxID=1960155 RepID=A0A1V4BR94_MICAE|nr:hypothetical protein [Microcystis aeruginosa]OPF16854.1 hypothetical protein B1L04_12035 [Microcystis aeruginosa KW]